MKTAFVFAVATLGFAATVAWAGETAAPKPAPARSGTPAPLMATPGTAAPSVSLPAANRPAPPRPAAPSTTRPEVLCACAGGDHFA